MGVLLFPDFTSLETRSTFFDSPGVVFGVVSLARGFLSSRRRLRTSESEGEDTDNVLEELEELDDEEDSPEDLIWGKLGGGSRFS